MRLSHLDVLNVAERGVHCVVVVESMQRAPHVVQRQHVAAQLAHDALRARAQRQAEEGACERSIKLANPHTRTHAHTQRQTEIRSPFKM